MRRFWPWLFLPVTALAVGMEIYSGVFDGPGTTPWTGYIVHYIPEGITMALIAVLTYWLPRHFISNYAKSGKGIPMSDPNAPAGAAPDAVPAPTLAGLTVPADLADEVLKLIADPKTAESEPLVVRALLVSLVCGVLAMVGVNLTPAWRDGILVGCSVLAPALLALWSRRTTWSPASVGRLLKSIR